MKDVKSERLSKLGAVWINELRRLGYLAKSGDVSALVPTANAAGHAAEAHFYNLKRDGKLREISKAYLSYKRACTATGKRPMPWMRFVFARKSALVRVAAREEAFRQGWPRVS